MGTLYVDTGGAATNSGSTDVNAADLTGTAATVAGAVVSLDGTPDLSGIVTSGDTQSTIHITDATNSNQKIFWITAADDGADTVTVTPSPTGVTSSAWSIGGRHVLTNASIEGALRAGDTVIFNNSPAASAATVWAFRNAGDSTSGPAKIKGVSGTRPVFQQSSSTATLTLSNLANCWVENIELVHTSAAGLCIQGVGSNSTFFNVKGSDSGDSFVQCGQTARFIACEFSGSGFDSGVKITSARSVLLHGCYIHDNISDGLEFSSATPVGTVSNCIIDTNTDRGIYISGATTGADSNINIINCTIYGNGDSGLESTDADTVANIINCIIQDNGNAAGEYNVEWVAGTAENMSFHAWNIFNKASNNLLNLTVNAQVASSEFTTDPLMTDPANGDFSLGSTSPGKATGFPGQLLGSSLGYLDMGAVQRQEPSGGGVVLSNMSGGMRG